MKLIDCIGVIGCFSLLVKIAIHVYLKYKTDKKYHVDPSGNMLNLGLFLPIFDDAAGYMKAMKRVGNILYVLSIILILVFVGVIIRQK